jgi:ACS family hexuronate transporter-like MFS transporter
MKSGFRWVVMGMIAVATVINYIDRNALAVMWPDISEDIGATKEQYALLVTCFMVSYAFGQSLFGRIFDWIGTRMGFVVSIVGWSISIALHAVANTILSFGIFRAMLGVSEAGAWPGSAKAAAEWFPIRERAFAMGIFNAGASIGGIVSAPLIAVLWAQFDWKGTFLLIGLLGVIWVVPWIILLKANPEKHPWVTETERQHIVSGRTLPGAASADDYAPTMRQLLRHKQSYAVILGRFFLDPIWFLFLTWLPLYLNETFDFDVKQIGLFGWVPFVGAMLGALIGGWFSGRLIHSGWSVTRARRTAITIGGAIMLPSLLLTTQADDPLQAVLTIAVVLFGFQFTIGNIQTLPSDFFGGKGVGSLAGMGGTAAITGVLIVTWLVPVMTKVSYAPVFILAAVLVPLSVACVWFFGGRIEPVRNPASSDRS